MDGERTREEALMITIILIIIIIIITIPIIYHFLGKKKTKEWPGSRRITSIIISISIVISLVIIIT